MQGVATGSSPRYVCSKGRTQSMTVEKCYVGHSKNYFMFIVLDKVLTLWIVFQYLELITQLINHNFQNLPFSPLLSFSLPLSPFDFSLYLSPSPVAALAAMPSTVLELPIFSAATDTPMPPQVPDTNSLGWIMPALASLSSGGQSLGSFHFQEWGKESWLARASQQFQSRC